MFKREAIAREPRVMRVLSDYGLIRSAPKTKMWA
jgi:hypothetical protein